MSLMALLSKVSKGYGALARKNLVIINVSRNHHQRNPHCWEGVGQKNKLRLEVI